MRVARALYPLRLTLQRQRLADLLRLDDRLISVVAELVRLRVLVQRAVADEALPPIEHDVAERRCTVLVGALDEPRAAALPIAQIARHDLLIDEELLVLLAIARCARIVIAVVKRERLGRACG